MSGCMEFCPRCGKYTVAFDSYRMVKRCLSDACSCIVIDENTYSHLTSTTKDTVDRVKVRNGVNIGIIKTYALA